MGLVLGLVVTPDYLLTLMSEVVLLTSVVAGNQTLGRSPGSAKMVPLALARCNQGRVSWGVSLLRRVDGMVDLLRSRLSVPLLGSVVGGPVGRRILTIAPWVSKSKSPQMVVLVAIIPKVAAATLVLVTSEEIWIP